MKCEHCGKNEATFYCKSNINGRITQVHLCSACAEALGYTQQMRSVLRPSFFSPLSLLSDFGMMPLRMLTEFPAPVETEEAAALGESPSDQLVSPDEQAQLRRQRERNALEAQLREAVAEERYEEAAKLRDQLKQLPQD